MFDLVKHPKRVLKLHVFLLDIYMLVDTTFFVNKMERAQRARRPRRELATDEYLPSERLRSFVPQEKWCCKFLCFNY